jgi:hypothetical protein
MSVTPSKIAVALGVIAPEPGSALDLQWSMWIDDATMLVENRRVKIGTTIFIDEMTLDYVIREAVVAHIKKPDDATQVTVAVDDGSTSRSYQSGKGRVTILDEWWTLLGLAETSGAFAIDTVAGVSQHLPWCSYCFGALYCSCGADIAGRAIYEGGEL